jgi:uncharacterized membrane protein (UPF0127 family)
MANIQRHVFVYNKTREVFLAFRVKVADSVFGRLVGLLGRRSLEPDSGVWIVPANAVHTIGMFKAESVLELPAHSIFRSRTQIGDQLLIERYEARKPSQYSDPEAMVNVQDAAHATIPTTPVIPILPDSSPRHSRDSKFAGSKTR